MSYRTSFVAGFAALVFLTGTAHAATLKVGRGKPHETIASAVAAAAPGDKIVIAKGRYVESVAISTPGLTLRALRGVEWHPEEWRGTCVTIEDTGTGATLQGFLFRGARNAVVAQAEGVSVLKCRFRGNTTAVDATGNDLLVAKCDIRQGSGGIQVQGDRARIEGCAVIGTRSVSVRIFGNDASVSKCTIGLVDDDPCVSVYGDRANVERNRLGVTEEDGIRVVGDDAVAFRNDIRLVEDDGVSVVGARAVIERNLVRVAGQNGIDVSGDGCVVSGNRVEDVVTQQGILVVGGAALVDGNTVSGIAKSSGIDVSGEAFTIRGNRVMDGGYGTYALRADAGVGGQEAGRVVENLVVGSTADGFRIEGVGVLVTDNRAEDCSEVGFCVSGSDHTLLRNVATGMGSHGFEVTAEGTTIRDCVAITCGIDGFRVGSQTTPLQLIACRASDCGAEGLHNSGLTNFADCTFANNRQDVASDSGTLTDGGGNVFTTGGVDSVPID